MKETVRLRIHVSEPFDFERQNGVTDLFGTTTDHIDPDAWEWIIKLEEGFTFNDRDYSAAMVTPRYDGEHLSRIFESFVGFPVRIAHPTADGWHFALTGLLSVPPREPRDTNDDDKDN